MIRILEDGTIREVVWNGLDLLPAYDYVSSLLQGEKNPEPIGSTVRLHGPRPRGHRVSGYRRRRADRMIETRRAA